MYVVRTVIQEKIETFIFEKVVMLVNDGNDSDIVERTLCQLPFVHVFRIPVRKSSGKFE